LSSVSIILSIPCTLVHVSNMYNSKSLCVTHTWLKVSGLLSSNCRPRTKTTESEMLSVGLFEVFLVGEFNDSAGTATLYADQSILGSWNTKLSYTYINSTDPSVHHMMYGYDTSCGKITLRENHLNWQWKVSTVPISNWNWRITNYTGHFTSLVYDFYCANNIRDNTTDIPKYLRMSSTQCNRQHYPHTFPIYAVNVKL
jgi:hypothetical protein